MKHDQFPQRRKPSLLGHAVLAYVEELPEGYQYDDSPLLNYIPLHRVIGMSHYDESDWVDFYMAAEPDEHPHHETHSWHRVYTDDPFGLVLNCAPHIVL